MESYTKQINRCLHGIHTIQEIARKANLIQSIQALQSWQNQKFLQTHQELLTATDSKAAIEALVYQLFSLREFTKESVIATRSLKEPSFKEPFLQDLADKDLSKQVKWVSGFLPKEVRRALASCLQLNLISLELDFELAQKVKTTTINQDIYSHAYIASYNERLRKKQVECLTQVGADLARVNSYWGTSSLLKLYTFPAKLCGLSHLHEFIYSSVSAFGQLNNTERFIQTLLSKESELMPEYINYLKANKAVIK